MAFFILQNIFVLHNLIAATLALPAPAQGPVNSLGIPVDLPLNETALYPPYSYEPSVDSYYIPSQKRVQPGYALLRTFLLTMLRGISMAVNTTKQPWNIQAQPDSVVKPAPHLGAAVAATCTLTQDNPSAFWYSQVCAVGSS